MPPSVAPYRPSNVLMTVDVMSSLETVEPSLEEYLRTFGFDPAALPAQDQGSRGVHPELMEIGAPVSSSDSFLQGVLTGQWNAPPIEDRHHMSQQGSSGLQANAAQPDLYSNIDQFLYASVHQDHEGNTQPNHGSLGLLSIHTSEGGVTSQSGSSGGVGLEGNTPPLIPTPSRVFVTAEDSQANFMWDNFLRELGVQDDSK